MGLSENIWAAMLRSGVSQSDLTQRLGYRSHSAISTLLKRLETRPGSVEVVTLERIAAALGTTREELEKGVPLGQGRRGPQRSRSCLAGRRKGLAPGKQARDCGVTSAPLGGREKATRPRD